MPKPPFPRDLSDRDLVVQLKQLAERERQALADLVASLAEFDARRLYLGEGCASLFTYCTEVLHLSEHAAYRRIEAARVVRQFPVILDRLARGDINLTAVGLLKPHLTPENHVALLDGARHKSKRQVEEIVARLHPRADVPTIVRKLPQPKATAAETAQAAQRGPLGPLDAIGDAAPHTVAMAATRGLDRIDVVVRPSTDSGRADYSGRLRFDDRRRRSTVVDPRAGADATIGSDLRSSADGLDSGLGAADRVDGCAAPAAAPPPSHRALIVPLAPERYKVQMTVSASTHAKLRRVQDLLRHSVPDGDLAMVFDRALTVLLDQLEKTRLARTDHPRAKNAKGNAGAAVIPGACASDHRSWHATGAPRSRYVPASVRRAVWTRDGGRCTFVGREGRCRETAFLQLHHLVPYAEGGAATVSNLTVRCAAHNRAEWERLSECTGCSESVGQRRALRVRRPAEDHARDRTRSGPS